jgi:hypothetical protein
VGDREPSAVDRVPPVKEEVEVEHAGGVSPIPPPSASLALDREEPFEEGIGRQSRRGHRGGIEEVGLRRAADRGGPIEGGDPESGRE